MDDNKKVAIVSCYFIHNYGSMLQAYATQQILNKMNIQNETINVSGFIRQVRKKQYGYILRSGVKSGILWDRLGKAKNLIEKKVVKNDYTKNISERDLMFEKFADRYITKTPIYPSLKALSDSCADAYDTILLGSDQLWQPANVAADYYTLNWAPKTMQTVSYATSFGVSELPSDIKQKAVFFLSRFDKISVREEAGKKIVQELIKRDVPVVCDPTLLFTGDEWMIIQREEPIYNEPYIFCYFIGENEKARDFANQLRLITGLRIVSLTHIDHFMRCDEGYADIEPFDVGPAEFLNLIRNASYVCTDSFHCTVFSILYRRQFFEFKRYVDSSRQSTNSRIDSLFNQLGIKDRMYMGTENIKEVLNCEISYTDVYNRLETIRSESYEYLRNALILS